jgi:prepilin-type N-terminal cleavage/methylation domain-containing protein
MPPERFMETERGFTLIEVVFAVAAIAVVIAAVLGGFAAVSSRSFASVNRDLAYGVAMNALARARAGTAYLPSSASNNPNYASQDIDSRTWAIAGTSGSFTTQADVIGINPCGGGASTVRVSLQATYTYNDATKVFLVNVNYPLNACVPSGATATVTLSAVLPLPRFAPGSIVNYTIGQPSEI